MKNKLFYTSKYMQKMRLFLVFIIFVGMSPRLLQAQCSWTNLSAQVQPSNCTGGSTGSITLSGLPTVDNGPGTLYTCSEGTPISGTTITVGPGEVRRLDVGANLDIIINGGTLITCGSISATSISLSNGGSLIVNGSFTSNANPTTIPSGSRVVNNNGSLYFPYPVVVNGGTLFNWYGSLTCASTLTNNGGVVRNTSTMYVNGSSYAVNYDPNDPNANSCSVTWSGTSQTGTSITNLAPANYTATITCGSCTTTRTYTVNTGAAPAISINPSSASLCAGESATLTASGANTYAWSPANDLNQTTGATVTATPSISRTYTVTGTATNGCTGTQTVTVSMKSLPVLAVTPSSASICAGGNVSLTATGATTYSWSPATGLNAITGATVTATPAASTTYTVTGTTDGCSASQMAAVTVNALPVVSVTSTKASNTTTCNGSAQASVSGGAAPYTYLWNGPNGFTSTQSSLSGLCVGNYTVTATTAQGCSAAQNTTVESCGFNYTIDKTHPTCFGGTNGSIKINGLDDGSNGGGAYGTYYTCNDGTPVSGTNIVVGPGEVKRLDGSNTVSTVTINGGTLITCGATWISSQLTISNGGTLFCIGSLTCQPAVVLPAGCKIINLFQSMVFHSDVTVNGLLLNVNGSLNVQTNLAVNGKVVNWTDFAATDFQVNSGGTVEHHGRWDSKWGTGTIATGGIFKTYGNSTFAVKDFVHNGSVVAETGTTNCFKITNSFASASQGAFTAASGAALNVCYASSLPTSVTTGSGVVLNNSSATCGNCTVYPPDPVGDVEGLFGGSSNTCTVTWTGTSQTGTSISGLTAGNYTATLTCGACTITETITLTGPASALAVSLGAVQHPSGNTCNGQATVLVSGGEAPYDIQWLGTAQTGLTASGLCNGQYLVKVKDARGCVQYLTVTMDGGGTPCLSVVLTKTNSNCPSKATGSVTAAVSGGEAPYTYTWNTGYTLSQQLNPVPAGGYSVLVKDKNGCVFVAATEVLNDHDTCVEVCPPAWSGSITKIKDSDCPTSCNGSAEAAVSGGSGSYTYLWNGNPGNALNTALCPLVYAVRVIDQATGCYTDLSGSVSIGSTNPTCPTDCNTFGVTLTASASLCPQKATGTITAAVTNGSGNYTITWSNGASNMLFIDHLPAQTQPYTVTIKDLTKNCEKTEQTTIGNAGTCPGDCNDNLAVQVKKTADADCPTTCNGAAEVTASGGSGSYIILWNGVQHGSAVRSDLCSIDYTVQLIDRETGCLSNSAPFKIGTLNAQCNPVCTTTCANIQVEYNNAAQYRITCECTEGSCFVIGTDGAPFAAGAWIDRPSHDAQVNVQLPCERIQVKVQGKGGPEIKVIPAVSYEGSTCNQNGTVTLNISGGSAPYTIRYNNQQTTSTTITGLPVGTTIFTITDHAGNSGDPLSVTVPPIPQPIVTASILSYWPSGHPKDLKATVTSTGTPGGAPYLVSWPALSLVDQSAEQTVQLPDDFNIQHTPVLTVIVKDRFGCTTSTLLPLISSCPESFTPVIVKTEPNCYGGQNGQLSITNLPSGASAQWTSINGSQSGSTATNLKAGTYTLVVLQQTGNATCVLYNGSATLTQPESPLSVAVSISNGSSYTATAVGGTLPVSSYNWSNGSTGATVNLTQSGNYSVTATDSKGCTATANFGMTVPICIGVITIQRINPSCSPGHDGRLEGSFSQSGYTTSWSGPGITVPANAIQTNLNKGDYAFTVSNGTCQAFAGVTLTEPLPLSAQFTITEEEAVKINVTNGTAPYTFSWSDNGSGQVRSDLIAGTTYTVHITDAKSCPLDYTFLYDPCAGTPMSAYVLITDNNKATPVVTGGTGVYTYAWTALPSGNPTADPAKAVQQNLPNGQYKVTIRDSKSCKTEATILLPGCGINPDPVVTNADCPTTCNGKITLTVQTGMTYIWDGQAVSSELINACSGNHILLVKTSEGCAKEYPLTVGTNNLVCPGTGDPCANSGLDASIFKRQEKKCFSDNSFVDIRVSGGLAPRTYTWSFTRPDGSTETYTSDKEDLENPAPGNYTLVVKDANGCETKLNVTVAGPSSTLTATAEAQQPACTGATGSAALNIAGGLSPYTVQWPDGQNSLNRSDLTAGHYNVLISDAAGCTTNANLDIIAPVFPGELYTSKPTICPDEFVTLTARSVSGYTYSWTGPGITTALTTQDIKVKLAGEYTLTYLRQGCNNEAKNVTLTAASCSTSVPVACTPIVLEEFPFDEPAACINQQRIAATASAVTRYENYLEEEKRQFKSAYINKIMTEATETLHMSYTDQEGHYTLYYYDQAGNLVRTVPPAGVKPLNSEDVVKAQNDLKNDTRTVFPEHTLATTYTYNSLNQLIAQDMPDHRKQQLWETAAVNIALQSGEQIQDVQYQSADKAVLIANNSDKAVLFTTTDGGTTWNRIENIALNNLKDIQKVEGTATAYAAGLHGTFIKSEDNGVNWIIRPVPTEADLIKVYFTSAATGAIMTSAGVVYKTDNGGDSWPYVHTDLSSTLSTLGQSITAVSIEGSQWYVTTTDANTVTTGHVWHSTDGGVNWSEEFMAAPALQTIDKNAQQSSGFYAAGPVGTLLRLNASGELRVVRTDLTKELKQLHTFSTSYYALSTDNTLYVSSNGTQWITQSGNPTDISKLYRLPISETMAVVSTTNKVKLQTNNWNEETTGLAAVNTLTTGAGPILVNHNSSNYILAAGAGLAYRNSENSNNWQGITLTGVTGLTLKDVYVKSNYLWYLLATDGNVYATEIPADTDPDPNVTTIPANTLNVLSTAVLSNVQAFYRDGNTLFASTSSGIKYLDNTGNWTATTLNAWPSGKTASDVLSLSFRVTVPNINATVVFTDGTLQEFDNSGWHVRSTLLPQALKAIEVKGSSVWTGGDNGELYEKVSTTWNYRPHATSGISVNALTNNSGLTIASGNSLYDYSAPALTANTTYTGAAVTVLRNNGSRTLALNSANSVFKKIGANWQAVQTLPQPLFAIHIGSDNTDLLASTQGRVYRGTEGSYAETAVPKVLPLNAVSAGNGNTVVSVGKQGTVITSSDGGVNWTPRYSGTNAELISVAAKGNTMMAGAATGQIIYSTNGGLSWQSAAGTTADPVKAIRFSGANTVLALSGTKVLKSTAASPSFSTDKVLQATGQDLALDAEGYGFVVGDQGLAYKIVPNGATAFTYTSIATDDTPEDEKGTGLPNINYTGVTFHDRETGFITAVNGTVLKTIDGGFHWKTLQKTTTAGAPQLAFNNREAGTILQGDGTLGTLNDRSELFGSRFWYDQLGRLTLSQNAKQYNIDQYLDNATRQSVSGTGTVRAYSYTLYDHIGRITEVGELLTRADVPTFKHESQVNYTTLTTTFVAPALTREITKTYYNSAAFIDVYPGFVQDNLRPRVASTTYQDKQGTAYDRATHYSYDIHGNVKSLVQELTVDGTRLAKRIDYDYDLVSGKVNTVTYQKDKEDQLLHKYTYDGDNRITAVQTSKDGIIWDTDAKYQYYAHGPLARVELGEHKVETTDYAYTLQGWIKGVDGENFSYSLGYNNSDYTSIGNSNGLLATPVDKQLYNGNIATMSTEIPFFGTQPGESARFDQQFSYDQLNRIKTSQQLSGTGYQTTYDYDANGNITDLSRRDKAGALLDDLHYNYENKDYAVEDARYKYNTNKLRSVNDGTVTGGRQDDLESQGVDNYEYDDIGNLMQDDQEDIEKIEWTVYGKVKSVTRKSGSIKPSLEFAYDASGNRISKKVTNPTTGIINTTFYVRDASGNTMAIYEKATAAALPLLSEQHLYGSQRLGILKPTMPALQTAKHFVGLKEYELNDHLGNVSVTLSDYKFSGVRSAVNYYPFGMMARSYNSGEMRYGFNGKEIDNEGDGGGGATYDYGARIYNPQIAKFLSRDPLAYAYPMLSPYQYASNMPVLARDLDGMEAAMDYYGTQNFYLYQSFTKAGYTEAQAAALAQEVSSNQLKAGAAGVMTGAAIASGYGIIVEFSGSILTYLTTLSGTIAAGAQRYGNQAMIAVQNWGGDAANFLYGLFTDDPVEPFPSTSNIQASDVGQLSRRSLKFAGNGLLETYSGLKFAFRQYFSKTAGSIGENGLSHVFKHTANDLTKPKHSVFDKSGGELIEVLDKAWEVIKNQKWDPAQTTQTIGNVTRTVHPNGNINYIVETGARVGYEGGSKGSGDALTKVLISVDKNTQEVVTAFPTK